MAAARRSVAPGPSINPRLVILPLAVLGAVAAAFLHYPAVPVVYTGMAVAGLSSRPPELTGPKDATGRPTPATDREERLLGAHRLWQGLGRMLVMPVTTLIPGRGIEGVWVVSLVVGALAGWSLPCQTGQEWMMWANGVCASLAVVCTARQRRMQASTAAPHLEAPALSCLGLARVISASSPLAFRSPVMFETITYLEAGARLRRLLPTRRRSEPQQSPPEDADRIVQEMFASTRSTGTVGLVIGTGSTGSHLAEKARQAAVKVRQANSDLDIPVHWPRLRLPWTRRTTGDTTEPLRLIALIVLTITAVTGVLILHPLAPAVPLPVAVAAAVIAAAPLAYLQPWRAATLHEWQLAVEEHTRWAPLFEAVRLVKPTSARPQVVSARRVGPAVVTRVKATPETRMSLTLPKSAELQAHLGGGVLLAILPVTDENGAEHDLDFEAVQWPADHGVDVTDADTDAETVRLLLSSCLAWACDEAGLPRLRLDACGTITEHSDDTGSLPQAWAFTLADDDMGAWQCVRTRLAGPVSARLGARVRADHRRGLGFVGALDDARTVFAVDSPIDREGLARLDEEEAWDVRWSEVLKVGAMTPRLEHDARQSAPLGDATVEFVPFVVRHGIDVARDYSGHEDRIATALDGAPFVAVTGFEQSHAAHPPGNRHPSAVCVIYSRQPVPSRPSRMHAPWIIAEAASVLEVRSELKARAWVMAGMVNRAFQSVRLAEPQLIYARCLTARSSPGHIWEVEVRLYGGVTLAQLRQKATGLRESFGDDWLRLSESENGVLIHVGAEPSTARLEREKTDRARLVALDWSNAFEVARLVGDHGLLPRVISSETLPENEQVTSLRFQLPKGLDLEAVRRAQDKLKAASQNEFVQVKPVPGNPTQVRVLCSPADPMPSMVPVLWDQIDSDQPVIPFALSVEGRVVSWDPRESSHLGVFGASNGGKSVLVQDLLTGVLCKGWGVSIIDPSKGGVDFTFAEPYVHGIARTLAQARLTLAAAYEDVERKKAVALEHGVGNFRDLPDGVRWVPEVLILDEFTSMMTPAALPPAGNGLHTMKERQRIEAENAVRAEIATLTGKIVRESRFVGYSVILATQALKADTLRSFPGMNDVKDNMARIFLGRASFAQLQTAFRTPEEAPRLGDEVPKGRGLFEPSTQSSFVFQASFEPGGQDALAREISARREPLEDALRHDYSVLDTDIEGDSMFEEITLGSAGQLAELTPAGQESDDVEAPAVVMDDDDDLWDDEDGEDRQSAPVTGPPEFTVPPSADFSRPPASRPVFNVPPSSRF